MDSSSHSIRFAETPPGSPKSCMKGARKIAFEEKPDSYEVPTSVPKSPRKSAKVSIRSPGDSSSFAEKAVQPLPPPIQKPPDIQFSQHYDQSTPPPNCTSNGSYDFVEAKVDDTTESDPRNDPELVGIATKFVNEIIETAKLEAASREKPEERGKPNLSTIAREIFNAGRSGTWVRRAQGTLSKWVTNLCVKAQNTIRT